jgi:hypothetical protein
VTDAELRSLLLDCLKLWDVEGRLVPAEDGWQIETAEGVHSIVRARVESRPARWFLQTPERRAAGRPARPAPSIVAALSAMRNNLGAAGGRKLRIGAASAPPTSS